MNAKSKQALSASAIIGSLLLLGFQNCSNAHFSPVEVQEASQSLPAESPAPAPAPLPAPAPVVQQPVPVPVPIPQVPTLTYSTCQSLTLVEPCPSDTPNCTCTDTLPGGTYSSNEFVIHITRDASDPEGMWSTGPNCKTATKGVHSGTVVGDRYGVCEHYCSIYAKCIDGEWKEIKTTW